MIATHKMDWIQAKSDLETSKMKNVTWHPHETNLFLVK